MAEKTFSFLASSRYSTTKKYRFTRAINDYGYAFTQIIFFENYFVAI